MIKKYNLLIIYNMRNIKCKCWKIKKEAEYYRSSVVKLTSPGLVLLTECHYITQKTFYNFEGWAPS
jgi:hypothetical protein